MNGDNRIKLMREGKVSTSLLKFGIPMVISMLVTALYNVVDTYFVGRLGTSPMAAVAVAFPISIIFCGLGLMFGCGGGSYISRLLGQKNQEKANQVASIALFSSIIIGIILSIIILIFLEEILIFMGATKTILPYAKDYAVIFIISAIFSTGNVAIGNLAVSQGASNITLTAMITGAILNMTLDPLMIYTFGLGIKGAAIATLISQMVNTLVYVSFFATEKSYIKIKMKYCKLDQEIYRQIFKIGISMLLLQVFSSISMSLISREASNYGDSAVAAMGLVLRIITLGSNVVFGFIKGFQPLAGYSYGAKNYERLKEAIHIILKWTTVFCILWTIVTFIFTNPIISLFSNHQEVIDIAKKALRANTIMFFTFGFQFVYSTLFLSLGKAKIGGILSMSRQGIFLIPILWILPQFMGLSGVMYAQAIADLFTTILTIVFAVKIHKQINILEGKSVLN
ncbi:MATE family efflux transporter [Inediibacterium massiliense]|uniref:MATE family efflux transporter n=1 Tax=Inediibacterium massiliense TaxID=1658111 RepID=UPI0006B65B47|nr:MATE family efflux transporter [Inediibacterium massiliense]